MRKALTTIGLVSAIALGISACGSSKSDRALSGAGLGAGVGAAAGALTGGSVVGGAVLGGAAGAATGALTKKKDVDLGDPAWK